MFYRCLPALVLFLVVIPTGGWAQNPIQAENANQGTDGWQLSNPALHREIEGYASLTSVPVGQTMCPFGKTACGRKLKSRIGDLELR